MWLHPAFARSIKELCDAGVRVGPEWYEPHISHQGSKNLSNYPWALALETVESGASGAQKY
jgi:hypothetical protein